LVRDFFEQLIDKKGRKGRSAFRIAGRADPSLATRKTKELSQPARIALQSGKTIFFASTIEITGYRCVHKASPETIDSLESLLPNRLDFLIVCLE
jgi:hypothetical protein